MGALDGRTVLVTGVLTEASIAFRVAEIAQREGATVILTGVGRSLSLTARIAKRLPEPAPVVPLDVTNDDELDGLADAVRQHADHLDGVLHAIGYRTGERARRRVLRGAVERCLDGAADLDVLARLARPGRPAADERRRIDRRARLRRDPGLAGV